MTNVTVSGSVLETAVRLSAAGSPDTLPRGATIEIRGRGLNVRHEFSDTRGRTITVSIEGLPLEHRTIKPPAVPETTVTIDPVEVAAFLRSAIGDRVRIGRRTPSRRTGAGVVRLENIDRGQILTVDALDRNPPSRPERTAEAVIAGISRQTLLPRLKALLGFAESLRDTVRLTVDGAGRRDADAPGLILAARTPTAHAMIAVERGTDSRPPPHGRPPWNLDAPHGAMKALLAFLENTAGTGGNHVSFRADGRASTTLATDETRWLARPDVHIDWTPPERSIGAGCGTADTPPDSVLETGAETWLRGLETLAGTIGRSDGAETKIDGGRGRMSSMCGNFRQKLEVIRREPRDFPELVLNTRTLLGITRALKANDDWGSMTETHARVRLHVYGRAGRIEVTAPNGDSGRAKAHGASAVAREIAEALQPRN